MVLLDCQFWNSYHIWSDVCTKYQEAAKIVNLALTGLITQCVSGSKIVDFCQVCFEIEFAQHCCFCTSYYFLAHMYDGRRSGFVSFGDIKRILVGNHMQSKRAVKNKARTLIRCAEADPDRGMTLPELMTAAAKFPNLLFPSHPPSSTAQMEWTLQRGRGGGGNSCRKETSRLLIKSTNSFQLHPKIVFLSSLFWYGLKIWLWYIWMGMKQSFLVTNDFKTHVWLDRINRVFF